MNTPAELKYTKDHEWVRVEGDVAVIGITDFAQSELGDIVFVDIQTQGENLGAGEVFGTIQALNGEERITEIGRMLGGTAAAIEHARALLTK